MAHGYGRVEDVLRRFQAAAETACPVGWITRYGDLGDEKLVGIRRIWESAGDA